MPVPRKLALLTLILACFSQLGVIFIQSPGGMQSMMMGGTEYGSWSTFSGADKYTSISGPNLATTTVNHHYQVMPMAGTYTGFSMRTLATFAEGDTIDLELFKGTTVAGLATTGYQCLLNGTAGDDTAGCTAAGSVHYDAGDLIVVESDTAFSPAGTQTARNSIVFTPDAGNGQPLLGHGSAQTGTFWLVPYGTRTILESTETDFGMIAPVDGTIGSLYIHLDTVQSAGNDYTFTVEIDGTPTAISCVVAGDGSLVICNDLDTADFNAGETLRIESVGTASVTTTQVAVSLKWTPDDGVTSMMGFMTDDVAGVGATEHGPAVGHDQLWQITANQGIASGCCGLNQTYTVSQIWCAVQTAPGSGFGWTLRLSERDGPSVISCVIADTATQSSELATSIVFTGDGSTRQMWNSVPVGSFPASTSGAWMWTGVTLP